MTFKSISSQPADWDCSVHPAPDTTGQVKCTKPNVASGSVSTFTLTAHIPPGTPGGTFYQNIASVNGSAPDPNSDNNEYPAAVTVAVAGCITNPVVTNSVDPGAGSLRQAIVDACDGSTISFDMTQVSSPITLTAGELVIDKNLTIAGPGANLLTVSGNQASRVFNISSGVTAVLSRLTIADGKVTGPGGNFGGGIRNNGGTLTIANSTLSGNSASGGNQNAGGGIFNEGALTLTDSTLSGNSISGGEVPKQGGGIFNAGTVTITNSTLSGNSVSGDGDFCFGGGILNIGTLTITTSTLSGNSVSGDNTTLSEGGGIYMQGGTANIRSTIIAQNTATTSGPDFQGTLTSQGHNLIGDTNSATIAGDTTGDILSQNPLLGPLQNNGGPTRTMALLAGSPALDAGDSCVLDNSCSPALAAAITADQRGAGFNRSVDGPDADTTATVDIGAFEAQVSIEDITDKTTDEDTQLQFTFNLSSNVTTVTATSSNPAVAPDPSLSGSGSTRTLTINPVANQFGTSTITVTVSGGGESMTDTFLLTVNPVGDTPSVTNTSTTVNTQSTSGLVITKNAVDGAEITNFKITNITNGTLFKNDGATQINNGDFITVDEGGAGLKFTAGIATGSFDVQAAPSNDGSGLSNTATATITIDCGSTVVTTNADSGAGSLRDVIFHACNGATITFAGGLASPITLTTGQLVIDKNLTITGPGANLLTISGNNASRIFNITTGTTVSITDLTLTKGEVSVRGGTNQGGAIFNAGALTLTNDTISSSVVSNPSAIGPNAGGGIFNAASGTIVMTGSTVSANFASGGASDHGGGIANLGTLTITASAFQGNSVRFAFGTGPNLSIKGGGIYNEGTLTVTSSSVAGNFIQGFSSDNEGGGIFSAGNATITNSLIQGNVIQGFSSSSGLGGGVRSVSNKLIIVNSTITANQVVNNTTNFGGGIENGGGSTLVLVSSTVASNSATGGSSAAGGGVRTVGPANVRNTIIALNSSTASPDADGTFNSQGHNLIQSISGSNGFGVNGDILGVDPLLRPLGDYGGPTQTMGLMAGSPALDAGDNCVTDAAHCSDPDTPQVTFDQRSAPFARSVDGPDADTTATVDIGAFEAQVSIEDIPAKTINEDSQLQFTFNIGGGANITSVTATSSNTTLVPNNAANIAVSGSGSTRTLTINPAANRFGTSTITVTVNGSNSQSLADTFALTVNPVPDTPSVTNASTTVNTQTTSGLVISRNAGDGTEVTHFKITNITGGTLFKNDGTTQINNNTFITFAEGNAGLKFTPPLNSNANGSFQLQASLSNNDGGLGGGLATATISVNCGSTVVINSNDSGAGSLRDTILHACDGATITFDLTPGKVANPINLTSGELLMNKNLIIQGPNANILTVQRSAAAGTPLFSIFNNPVGLSLGLSGLTLSNADNPGNGGAIKNAGILSLNSMALTNNHTAAAGSALFNAQTGNATVANSTLSNNNSDQFAAIYNQGGTLNLTNSTLTANANASNFPGAAIFSESFAGVTNITNCTISQNTGQTEVVWRNGNSGALINLKNTIVSGNTGGDVNGTTDLGNNLIGGNALLAPLGDYGGPTQTMALLPGSPAINAGTATGAPTTDQRGISRVGTVDIGAFESRGLTITAASGTPQSAVFSTAFGAPLQATVASAFGEPVSGGQVRFTAPGSGASATFTGGATTINVATSASGQASVPATANAITGGPYNVTATGNGVTGTANFSLTNLKADQTITFGAIANKTFGDPDFGVSATTTSPLPVSFAFSGNCTVSSPSPGTVHITGAGSCAITASQAGDANYNPATSVTQSFTINKANQTITFGSITNKTFGDPDFGVSATTTSPLPVSFAASGNCTVSSPSPGTVHITGAGTCTITASQTGDANYNEAPNVPQSFTIAKAVTNTAVSSSVNPSDLNESVIFTATTTSGAGAPTGTVQFKDNGTNLGAPVALNAGGVAQFTTSALTTGTHTITAEYSSDANFTVSTGTLSGGQVVKAQPSLSINDASITEGDAGTKVLNFTVTLSAASSLTVTTNYATANGTATAPSDYAAIASTLLTFSPGDTSKSVSVTINGDLGYEPDETFSVNLSNPVNATISDNQGLGTIQNDDVLGGFISFSQVNTDVNESTGIVTLTVVRTNDVSQAVNVDYATDDTGASTNCAALTTGLASQRCDYTSVFGTLKFAANETQKTVDIPINLDAYTEGPETFSLKLSNPTGGAVLAVPSTGLVTINDSASPAPNASDDTTTFVRQQYRDFLNREADAAGLAFWKNNIDKCNDPAQRPPGQTLAACIEVQRIVTSAAFFLSIEFKQTGGLVREFYVAALDRPATNNMPNFVEFMRDAQGIQKGVVVGQGNWQEVLDANRTAFMNDFVTRAEFVALYPTTDTPTQYVDKLYLHANVTGTQQERLDAVEDFGGAPTAADPGARGRALLRVTRDGNFQAREANRTFVQIEYFGYLRRDPDLAGFNFWVAKLDQFNGDFLQAEMVKAFLSSPEYRGRFGP
jgi:hypothetical protein